MEDNIEDLKSDIKALAKILRCARDVLREDGYLALAGQIDIYLIERTGEQ